MRQKCRFSKWSIPATRREYKVNCIELSNMAKVGEIDQIDSMDLLNFEVCFWIFGEGVFVFA